MKNNQINHAFKKLIFSINYQISINFTDKNKLKNSVNK